jgi:ATP-binding cassette, subfamily B, bacterial
LGEIRRILALFAPYRRELAFISAIILVTSALSVIAALLVRQAFNEGLFAPGGPDLSVLIPLVAVLVAIPIINGVLNIVQTYLTETVGNRVLQELRDHLSAHLERLSLAFYTATRAARFSRVWPTTSAAFRRRSRRPPRRL